MARACLSAIFLGPRLGHQRSGLGFLCSPDVVNFTGTVDEVAVYDRALDAERVKLHFTVGSSQK